MQAGSRAYKNKDNKDKNTAIDETDKRENKPVFERVISRAYDPVAPSSNLLQILVTNINTEWSPSDHNIVESPSHGSSPFQFLLSATKWNIKKGVHVSGWGWGSLVFVLSVLFLSSPISSC
jgi:hypothetical protein